ncbi:MAG: ABC transporter substrate-binding protein [Desulfonatronovibrio sp.]
MSNLMNCRPGPFFFFLRVLFLSCLLLSVSSLPVLADDFRLALVQSVKHPALDSVASGIKKYFHEQEIHPEFTTFISDHDSDSEDINSQDLKQIRSFNPHIIITIGTQASQQVSRSIDSVPIIFTAVTDPVGSGLVESMDKPGPGITGLTDLSPVRPQLDMIMRLQPRIQALGIVFSAFEQNAVTLKNHMKQAAKNYGISIVEAPVERGDRVSEKTLDILDSIDALYISTDNYVVARAGELAGLCASAKVPLYAADPDSVAAGAMVALSIDYFRMGLQTGAMSHLVLRGIDPGSIPVEQPREMTITVNVPAAQSMGIELPMDLIMAADKFHSGVPGENQADQGVDQ